MPTKSLTLLPPHPAGVPALVAAAGHKATRRYVEFFTAEIRNPRTRRAYHGAVTKFFT
jgi:integrase/recombinase XerD